MRPPAQPFLAVTLATVLAGCATVPTGENAFPEGAYVTTVEHDVRLSGALAADHVGPDGTLTGSFEAVNEGAPVTLPDCTGPWEFHLRGDTGERHDLTGGMGCTTEVRDPVILEAGKRVGTGWQWTGQAYDPRTGEPYEVPPGNLSLVVTFRFHRDGVTRDVTLDLPFRSAGPGPEVDRPDDPTPPPGPSKADGAAGVRVDANLSRAAIAPGDTLRANYRAYNEGEDATVRGGCESPWTVRVLDPNGEPFQIGPPTSVCLGFSQDPFPHEASLSGASTWNGTRYVDNAYEAAPPGDYTVEVSFRFDRDREPHAVRIPLPVEVVAE